MTEIAASAHSLSEFQARFCKPSVKYKALPKYAFPTGAPISKGVQQLSK